MASGDWKREVSIKTLAEAGYSGELCARLLDDSHRNESVAGEKHCRMSSFMQDQMKKSTKAFHL